MNYIEILNESQKELKKYKIPSPSLDCEILLSKVLNVKREYLLTNLDKKITEKEKNFFIKYVNRRKKKEPIAYIVGHKEFWKYNFKVNKNVLIPRPDTEILVEETIANIPINSSFRILDVGTGSGCVLLSVLKERKKCYGIGTDISNHAIKVAKSNAKIQHLENRCKFYQADIDNIYSYKYDLITSNPPYIKLYEINDLDRDIKNYEPKVALNGGIDGYSKIKLVIKKSSTLIKKKGKLILEVGLGQIRETQRILRLNGFYTNKVVKDLANKNRCIISTKA